MNLSRFQYSRVFAAIAIPLLLLCVLSVQVLPLKGEVSEEPEKPEAESSKGGFGKGMGKGKGKGRTEVTGEPPAPETGGMANTGPGFFTTITGIRGNTITFTSPDADGGASTMGKGKGKGKGGGASRGGPETTTRISDKVIVTTATFAQRTQDLLVGIELGGGLENPVFDRVNSGGLRARLVLKDDEVVEINVIVSEEPNDAPIAVKPKRPPSK